MSVARTVAAVLAAAIVLTGCSSSPEPEPSPTPTPTPSPSPSPTPEVGPISPLNGAPTPAGTNLNHRAIGVKVDNNERAQPQGGLRAADVVVEILVEGGFTRFLAIYHSRRPDWVGPIRSGRPTDATIAAALGAPLAISGAQGWVQSFIRNQGVDLIGHSNATMFRVSGRPAPHNLFTDINALHDNADSRDLPDDPPQVWLPFGPMAGDAENVASVTLDFGTRTKAGWTWERGAWRRSTYGVEHMATTKDGDERQLTADTILVLEMDTYTASPAGSGSSVPATTTVGSGPAWVFADGAYVQGTWLRENSTDPFTLTTDAGETLNVPPGRLWVELLPRGRAVTLG